MQKVTGYKTKQRNSILNMLRSMPQTHTTAEDLLELLQKDGAEIGLATIYRNLDKLVNEGLILKYTLPGGMKACYQFLDTCGTHPCHSHLICNHCGSITHLTCHAVDDFATHLQSEHGFLLDKQKTVLYGLCAQCTPQP